MTISERGSRYNVVVVRRRAELVRLRAFWVANQKHPNSYYDWFCALLDVERTIRRPYVLVVVCEGVPVALLACQVVRSVISMRVGYLRAFDARARVLSVSYGGLIGDQGSGVCEALRSGLVGAMESGVADVLWMNQLKVAGELRMAMDGWADRIMGPVVGRIHPHWVMDVKRPFVDVEGGMSSKARYNLRRQLKRLKSRFGDKVVIKCFQERGDLSTIIRHSEAVARKGYQRGLGAGFKDDEITRRMYELALRRSELRSYFLYLEGRPVAFCHVVVSGQRAYASGRGYDPRYRSWGVGNVLQRRVTEDLCTDEGVAVMDFGFGDAEYKRSLCDESWEEASVYVYAKSVWGLALRLGVGAAASLTSGLSRLSRWLDIVSVLKRWWRRRQEGCVRGMMH